MALASVAAVRCTPGTRAQYATMSRKSAMRGSNRYLHDEYMDERKSWPIVQTPRGSDNPFKYWRGWTRFRWMFHDIRVFGGMEYFWKWHYMHLAWNKKGEKIFMGFDENGNKYWEANETGPHWGSGHRMIEPVDPHWLRGGDLHCAPHIWQQWLQDVTAHSPAVVKARGEYGNHGRYGPSSAYNLRWYAGCLDSHGIDPCYVPQAGVIVSPWLKQYKEAGFSRWTMAMLQPLWTPLEQPHDLKPEVVEDFYRMLPHANRWSRGHDHDQWGNGGGGA